MPGNLAGRLQIDRLAADHPGRRRPPRAIACIARSFRAATIRSVRRRLPREQRKRFGLEPVSREDGDAVAVHDVQRRPASAQRVVVHRRQVVVNQRVGVNQLDRARRGKRESGDRVVGGAAASDGVGGGQGQQSAAAACLRRRRCSAWLPRGGAGSWRLRRDTARALHRPARARVRENVATAAARSPVGLVGWQATQAPASVRHAR